VWFALSPKERMSVTTQQRAAESDSGRRELEAERIDRNLNELLQELRVASIGVQVLFGFLLSLPFTARFTRLNDAQRSLYLAALLLAALSAALLIAPVAYHRLVFRRQQKERLLRTANRFALTGLVTVGITISVAVVLVVSVILHGAVVAIVAVATGGVFVGLWFALPMRVRRVAEREPQ
jgi:O-antigen/teichoic acid export membrane protein